MTKPRRFGRRRVLAAAGALFVVWAAAAAWLLGTAWKHVPAYEPKSTPEAVALILGPADYAAVSDVHPRPFVYRLNASSGGGVLVFGATHTKRPDDPQLDEIRAAWREMQPGLALIESDLGVMFPAFMDPVLTFGEVGMVHALARADDIATFTWEPPDERVIRSALDQGFTREQVALRWLLGPYFSQLRHGRPGDPEAFVRDTLDERSQVEGIRGVLASVAEIETAWRRSFPDGPDWRDVSDEHGLPGFLDAIDLNRARDEHLVACVADLVQAGQRVFVIGGSSHAVKIEPALRSLVQ